MRQTGPPDASLSWLSASSRPPLGSSYSQSVACFTPQPGITIQGSMHSSILFPTPAGAWDSRSGWRSGTHEIRGRGPPGDRTGTDESSSHSSWRTGDGRELELEMPRPWPWSWPLVSWGERRNKWVACALVLHTFCLVGPQLSSLIVIQEAPAKAKDRHPLDLLPSS